MKRSRFTLSVKKRSTCYKSKVTFLKAKPYHPTPASEGACPAPDTAAPPGWRARLKRSLSKTNGALIHLFSGAKIDGSVFEALEDALLMADAGVAASGFLTQALRQKARAEHMGDGEAARAALRALLAELLQPLERPLAFDGPPPRTILMTGVNGAGKTTSIGKLVHYVQRQRKSVLLAAGDTFRAAAREQLIRWGERNQVHVIAQQNGDPAAVIFDAVAAARARGIDVLIADTAGRLPTQSPLMEELKKIKRVMGKALTGAPHEVFLTIDANTGQNALAQVQAFDAALGLTGLIVTKLDGTAKGGILAAIAREHPVPVVFTGTGEQIDDLQPFCAKAYAQALLA